MAEDRLAAQTRPNFQSQLGISRAKFYQLAARDPSFPKPFEIGGRKVYYVHECNEYVRRCAERAGKAA